MIRNPAPFILLLGLAGTQIGSPALSASLDQAGDPAPMAYTGEGADSGIVAPVKKKTRRHAAAAPATDLTEADMPAGMPALLAGTSRPAPARTVTPRPTAAMAYSAQPLSAPITAGPIATTPLAVAQSAANPGTITRIATTPLAPPAPATPEFPQPGITTPPPTMMPMQPPAVISPPSVMSPVLPRQPAQAMPPPRQAYQPPAPAQPAAPRVTAGANSLAIDAGMGRVVQLSAAAASVFAADPKVAEVRPAAANSLFIFGVAPGRTTIAALDAAGKPVAQYDVIVQPSSYGAVAARAAVSRILPGTDIRVDTEAGNLAVSGTVSTPAEAARAMDIVRGFTPAGVSAINNMSVTASMQVNLRVRIAEMSRNLTRDLGVNWQAAGSLGKYAAIGVTSLNPLIAAATAGSTAVLGGGYNNVNSAGRGANINGFIDALAQDQLVHMLAEPNLTAISGQTASFLVGGEFPIPVAQQNNTVTIEFKQFGVSLAFVPTVMSDGHINLKVRPEVSALSDQGAVQLSAANSSISIPALTVRRAETTVELGSGQSFAIAGLLQDSAKLTGNGFPILGDLPILGALFRSDNFQRNETELVIIVTPTVVRPVVDPTQLRLPTDNWQQPNDFERILLLRQNGRGTGAPASAGVAPAHIPGSAGFMVQ